MSVIDQIAIDQIADERDKAQQENKQLKSRIKRLEQSAQEIDKEWFQVIESILGFHPVSMTEALRIGIERIKKQKQRIKRLEEESESRWLLAQSAVESCAEMSSRIQRLEEAGDELLWAFCPASVSMMTERESDALKLWNEAKEAKL